MSGSPIVAAAREVIGEVPERYDDYRADLIKALVRIATLDDPSAQTRRKSTSEVIAALADKVVEKGGIG